MLLGPWGDARCDSPCWHKAAKSVTTKSVTVLIFFEFALYHRKNNLLCSNIVFTGCNFIFYLEDAFHITYFQRCPIRTFHPVPYVQTRWRVSAMLFLFPDLPASGRMAVTALSPFIVLFILKVSNRYQQKNDTPPSTVTHHPQIA